MMKTFLSVSSVLAMAAMITSCGNSGAKKLLPTARLWLWIQT